VSAPSFVPVSRVFAPDSVGATVRIRGWVQKSRSSGGILFLLVRDRTATAQATAKKDTIGPEVFDAAEHVQVEGTVEVEGTVADDPRAPGKRELRATAIRIVDAGAPFPIFQEQTEEFRLDKRHLVIRSPEYVATFRVKAEVLRAAREFLAAEDVLEVTPPILTGNPAEGGAEAFQIDYFGRPGYLAQTAQLYLEAMLAPHERVYSLTPSFRAEKSRTPRHINEFQHLEVELAWVELDGLMEFIERMVSAICRSVAERCPAEVRALGRAPEELLAIRPPFPRMSYADAIEKLSKLGLPVHWGSDLATAEERTLTLEEKLPRFVTRYPREIKAFYMERTTNDPRTVEAADLLAPEGYGEMVGASCRETNLESLRARIVETGGNVEEYEWYLDLRRHGNVPHAGFGLGVERIVRWMLRLEHIRDATPFPRTPSRHTP
jgi:asparaginyl-tRNA synthetase